MQPLTGPSDRACPHDRGGARLPLRGPDSLLVLFNRQTPCCNRLRAATELLTLGTNKKTNTHDCWFFCWSIFEQKRTNTGGLSGFNRS